jgi:hypothetical protein
VVSGDVAYRVTYILAFIGAAPLSILGVLLAGEVVIDPMVTDIGESNTIVVLAAVAAVFVFAVIFTLVRYPVPSESFLGLWAGLLSSALASIILWGWLTYEYGYELPLLHLSEFYNLATLTFLDILLAATAVLVALMTTTEKM